MRDVKIDEEWVENIWRDERKLAEKGPPAKFGT